jgi:hypothetical protein
MRTLVCSVLMLACVLTGRAADPPAEDSASLPRILKTKWLLIPDDFRAAVTQHFPGYRLPSIEDFLVRGVDGEPFYIYSWDTTLPYICWGDFNCDSRRDITTYLIRETLPSRADSIGKDPVLLVVFHGHADGYQPMVLDTIHNTYDWLLFNIGTDRPGDYLTVKGKGYEGPYPENFPDSIHLDCNGIASGKFGSAGGVYY